MQRFGAPCTQSRSISSNFSRTARAGQAGTCGDGAGMVIHVSTAQRDPVSGGRASPPGGEAENNRSG
jgi:hypothetical protein